ncbi:MAG TPA: proline dehydrogenase family protein [Actinomycetota bacterium]
MDLSTDLLRPAILRVAHHPAVRGLVTGTTPGRAVASRFVAGETLSEAMDVAADLDRRRIAAMLDHLGENVESPAQALQARASYLAAIEALKQRDALDGAISVKLTQLGLDRSVTDCWDNLAPILEASLDAGRFVMIDMESHPYVDATLEVLRRGLAVTPSLGVCLQAYLKRTATDIFEIPTCRVRLVKGAYLEPPDMVYVDKDDVNAAFKRLFVTLLSRGHAIDVATHDPALLDGVRRRVDAVGDGWSRVEFQMLYGVRRDLQATLAGKGYPVRVYIPYGTEWYPYLTRRMAERPANVWFFLSNLVRTG